MTTFTVPPAGAAAWHEIYPAPHAVRFDVGPFCPMDDTVLQGRSDGWGCPTCRAAWDFFGEHGRWLPTSESMRLRQLDRRLAAVGAVSFGSVIAAIAGRQIRSVGDDVPVELVCTLALILAVVAGLMLAGAWLAGWRERRRYARNEVAVCDTVELVPFIAGEVIQ